MQELEALTVLHDERHLHLVASTLDDLGVGDHHLLDELGVGVDAQLLREEALFHVRQVTVRLSLLRNREVVGLRCGAPTPRRCRARRRRAPGSRPRSSCYFQFAPSMASVSKNAPTCAILPSSRTSLHGGICFSGRPFFTMVTNSRYPRQNSRRSAAYLPNRDTPSALEPWHCMHHIE